MTNPIIQIKRVQNFATYNAGTGGYLQFGELLFDQNKETLRIGVDGGAPMGNCPVFFPGMDFNYADSDIISMVDTLPNNATNSVVTKSFLPDETCWYYFIAACDNPNTSISYLSVEVTNGTDTCGFLASGMVASNTSQGLRILVPLQENSSVSVKYRAVTSISIWKIPIITTQFLTHWDEGV